MPSPGQMQMLKRKLTGTSSELPRLSIQACVPETTELTKKHFRDTFGGRYRTYSPESRSHRSYARARDARAEASATCHFGMHLVQHGIYKNILSGHFRGQAPARFAEYKCSRFRTRSPDGQVGAWREVSFGHAYFRAWNLNRMTIGTLSGDTPQRFLRKLACASTYHDFTGMTPV